MTEILPTKSANIPGEANFTSAVSHKAISELFARDPENLSDQELGLIVTELRSQRARFELSETTKAMQDKKPKAKGMTKEEAMQMTLEDLI